ncbi:uncharacterized protein LOC119826445 [Arvicola amphibius]|uniref:uncharacterized protein LOC119826445 n=1 Tax=Arvicola amphibius TaxID=1047088 RepID=UPI0018E2A2CF|nr:uncharacterized protein LOC119826445 [Arvicola amphibius]
MKRPFTRHLLARPHLTAFHFSETSNKWAPKHKRPEDKFSRSSQISAVFIFHQGNFAFHNDSYRKPQPIKMQNSRCQWIHLQTLFTSQGTLRERERKVARARVKIRQLAARLHLLVISDAAPRRSPPPDCSNMNWTRKTRVDMPEWKGPGRPPPHRENYRGPGFNAQSEGAILRLPRLCCVSTKPQTPHSSEFQSLPFYIPFSAPAILLLSPPPKHWD